MAVVVDSSVALAWCFEDERTETALNLFRYVTENGAVVPDLWRYEIAGGLHAAMMRGRIDRKYRDATFADLGRLAINIDTESGHQVWTRTAHMAERFRLTIYDAAYLELAERKDLPLATFDAALLKAAKTAGCAIAK